MSSKKIATGLVLAAVFFAAVFWLPMQAGLFLLLAICGLCTWEFYALLGVSGIPHFKFVGLIGGLAMIVATWMSSRGPSGMTGDMDWLVLFVITAGVFVRQFPQKNNPRPLETVAGTLLGVLYVPFLFNFVTKLLVNWGDQPGRLLVLYLVLVVKSVDTGAYFVGCAVGRHKLIPRLSPAKTWEGAAGGAAAGIAMSALFCLFSGGHLGPLRWTLVDALVLGALLTAAGMLGDLTESLFKRAAGVKDSGRVLIGMGGMLDVIDSLLFTAPTLYVYACFFLETAR